MLDTAATGKWRRQPYCALRRNNRSLLCLRQLQLAERRAGLRDCFIAEEFLLTADCPKDMCTQLTPRALAGQRYAGW